MRGGAYTCSFEHGRFSHTKKQVQKHRKGQDKMSEKNQADVAAVAAVFGQSAIDKAAGYMASAASQYGKVSGYIRQVLSCMIANGRKPQDIEPEDRQAFVSAACAASGKDCKALVASGEISRIAKDMGFKVADKNNKNSAVVKINCRSASVADVSKAVKAIVKAMVKNGADKADVIAAIQAAVK